MIDKQQLHVILNAGRHRLLVVLARQQNPAHAGITGGSQLDGDAFDMADATVGGHRARCGQQWIWAHILESNQRREA